MIVIDKTGRKLKDGQIVDLVLVGTYQGRVRLIKETPIEIPGQGQIQPHVVFDLVVTAMIQPTQKGLMVPNIYILAEPEMESKDGKVIIDGNFDRTH